MRISDWSSDVCSSDLDETPDAHRLGGKRAVKGAEDIVAHSRDRIALDQGHMLVGGRMIDGLRLPAAEDAEDGIPVSDIGQFGDQLDLAALDRKSTRLNSSHYCASRMPSSA